MPKPIVCPEPDCGREFKNAAGLAIHRGRSHSDLVPLAPPTIETAVDEPDEETETRSGVQLPETCEDIIRAIAFLEERDPNEVLADVLSEWETGSLEDEHVAAVVEVLRARRA